MVFIRRRHYYSIFRCFFIHYSHSLFWHSFMLAFGFYYEKNWALLEVFVRKELFNKNWLQLKVACWCPSKYSCLKPSVPLLVLIVVSSRSFLNAHTHFCKEKTKLPFDKGNTSKSFRARLVYLVLQEPCLCRLSSTLRCFLRSFNFSRYSCSVRALATALSFARILCLRSVRPLQYFASHLSYACSRWMSQMYIWLILPAKP